MPDLALIKLVEENLFPAVEVALAAAVEGSQFINDYATSSTLLVLHLFFLYGI